MSGNHAEFAPSSLDLYADCPAAWSESRGLPEETSEAAESGSRIHAWLAASIMGEQPPLLEDEEELALARKCLEHYQSQPRSVLAVEEPLKYEVLGETLFFGTPDLILHDLHGSLRIIDWKTGRLEVRPAPQNLQAAAYALMALQRYPVGAINFEFFNPRNGQRSEARFTDFRFLAARISKVIAACREEEPEHRPGACCARCRAGQQGKCRYAAIAAEAVVVKAEGGVQAWDDQTIAEAWEHLAAWTKNAKRIAEAIEEEIKARWMRSGKPVAGLEVRERRAALKVAYLERFCAALAETFSGADVADCMSISLPALQRKAKTEEQKKALEAAVSEFASRGESTQYVARSK